MRHSPVSIHAHQFPGARPAPMGRASSRTCFNPRAPVSRCATRAFCSRLRVGGCFNPRAPVSRCATVQWAEIARRLLVSIHAHQFPGARLSGRSSGPRSASFQSTRTSFPVRDVTGSFQIVALEWFQSTRTARPWRGCSCVEQLVSIHAHQFPGARLTSREEGEARDFIHAMRRQYIPHPSTWLNQSAHQFPGARHPCLHQPCGASSLRLIATLHSSPVIHATNCATGKRFARCLHHFGFNPRAPVSRCATVDQLGTAGVESTRTSFPVPNVPTVCFNPRAPVSGVRRARRQYIHAITSVRDDRARREVMERLGFSIHAHQYILALRATTTRVLGARRTPRVARLALRRFHPRAPVSRCATGNWSGAKRAHLFQSTRTSFPVRDAHNVITVWQNKPFQSTRTSFPQGG